ncbi:serine hydrolase domain-containing protein [Streptomyces roseus]|uniref:Beta-lactamase-related domain-containing protein n=1 Tax=Streptomyces roseus TaxID=66430 RepID=A0A0J7A803_9ACTN|nr:serine hydrolase domain-containing protein [Streptomyces roseus]KMO93416.1 hypothetical protein ACS04_34535 [Streptomyces roseus]
MGRYRTPTAVAAACLLLTALCAGQAPAAAPPGRIGIDDVTAEKLDDAITAAMREAGIPGVGVGLWVDGDGSYVRAFGTSDKTTGTPVKTDMHTRIGSVTKTFTITGVLQLVDDGKVRLDAPISTYLDGVPGGDRITVRLPQDRATLVIIVNSDVDGKFGNLSSLIANRITKIVSPKHVWSLSKQPNALPEPSSTVPPASPKPQDSACRRCPPRRPRPIRSGHVRGTDPSASARAGRRPISSPRLPVALSASTPHRLGRHP